MLSSYVSGATAKCKKSRRLQLNLNLNLNLGSALPASRNLWEEGENVGKRYEAGVIHPYTSPSCRYKGSSGSCLEPRCAEHWH